MTSPYYAKQTLQDLLGGTREYDPGYVQGEIQEFLDAYKNRDIPGVEEELQDVLYGAQMLAYQATKKDMPIYGADDKIREFYRRNAYLDQLFKQKNLTFHPDYTVGGSNVRKPEKIQAAFELAGHPITPREASRYSRKYDSFKGASFRKKTPQEIVDLVLSKN